MCISINIIDKIYTNIYNNRMRYLYLLSSIFILFSCQKEKHEVLTNNENNQVYYYNYTDYGKNKYYGNYNLKIEIQINLLDKNYNINNYTEYFVNYNAGKIENGKLLLQYNIIDEKYCNDILDELRFSKYINISNNNAKIKKIHPFNINVYDHDNKIIGFLRFENYTCKLRKFGIAHSAPCSTIYYIYATEETKITGTYDYETYDLDLKKGWNIVYYYENSIVNNIIITTNNKFFPEDVIWQIILLD